MFNKSYVEKTPVEYRHIQYKLLSTCISSLVYARISWYHWINTYSFTLKYPLFSFFKISDLFLFHLSYKMPITYTRVQSLVHGQSCPNLIGYRNIFSAISLDNTLIHISRTRSSTNYAKFREWTRNVYENKFRHDCALLCSICSIRYLTRNYILFIFFPKDTLNMLHIRCFDFIYFHTKPLL